MAQMSKKPKALDPHWLPPAEANALELASWKDETARLKALVNARDAEIARLKGLLKFHLGKDTF